MTNRTTYMYLPFVCGYSTRWLPRQLMATCHNPSDQTNSKVPMQPLASMPTEAALVEEVAAFLDMNGLTTMDVSLNHSMFSTPETPSLESIDEPAINSPFSQRFTGVNGIADHVPQTEKRRREKEAFRRREQRQRRKDERETLRREVSELSLQLQILKQAFESQKPPAQVCNSQLLLERLRGSATGRTGGSRGRATVTRSRNECARHIH